MDTPMLDQYQNSGAENGAMTKEQIEKNLLSGLNPMQKKAVLDTNGPLLILAGAGSGKTRVLTYRIGYLIARGVMPWQILAITFTNKAAAEMRERVEQLLAAQFGETASGVFVSTFHSMCVRILRRDIDRLGYARDFSIYDTDDQRTLMRQVIKMLNLDPKMYRERAMLHLISGLKNEMTDWETYQKEASDYYERNAAKIYAAYQQELQKNNALDFDDLLLLTVELFKEFPEVLAGWQERFHYIMVDEYQDTNAVQFAIVQMLSARYKNLCVVGDDDQSIYKFRGADVGNILSFEHSFPGAHVIKLEQNYRSTKRILAAANEVIQNNTSRKEKQLWTDNEEGSLPQFHEYETAGAEADAIIKEAASCGLPLRDQAVLYRTNAQSRLLEEKCIQRNVPYIVVGGVNFYQRKEIKDILSYLRIVANDVDDLALARILNVPKRGIGATSLSRAEAYAGEHGTSLYQALCCADQIPSIGSAAKKIRGFVEIIEKLREKEKDPDSSLKCLIEAVRDDTGYAEELRKEGEIESQTRLENIDELINKAVDYEEQPSDSEKSLSGFLEDVSLVADIDRTSDSDDVLKLMTLHAAKGLEFDKVYLCGMEDGLFPSAASINAENPEAEIEEERRLCYVGITRAKKELRMSSAGERMINGELRRERISRFVDELPEDSVIKYIKKPRAASWEAYVDDYDKPIPSRGFAGGSNSFAETYGGFGPAKGAAKQTDGAASRILGSFGSLDRSGWGKGGPRSRQIDVTKGHDKTTAFQHAASSRFPASSAFEKSKSGGHTQNAAASGGLAAIPGIQRGIAGIEKHALAYAVGDRVEHIKFGKGTVQKIEEGKKDFEVTVDFDTAGTKRMFAGFAKLKKL